MCSAVIVCQKIMLSSCTDEFQEFINFLPLNVYFDLDSLKPKVAVKRCVYEVLLRLNK